MKKYRYHIYALLEEEENNEENNRGYRSKEKILKEFNILGKLNEEVYMTIDGAILLIEEY